jgi:putative addiction module killer protein
VQSGAGVCERRINFGPGYRIYFDRDGAKLVILLGGGSNARQRQDIRDAQRAWQEYQGNRSRS